MSAKKTKPSNRKIVFNTKTNKWVDLSEERELMELEKIKQEQAKKTLDDLDDEPIKEDEL